MIFWPFSYQILKKLKNFKTICQQILYLLIKCCQKVEGTLYGYHGQDVNQPSSRDVGYVCQCESSSSKNTHYIIVNAKKQTCSHPVYCEKVRSTHSLTQRESMWFEGEIKNMLSFLKCKWLIVLLHVLYFFIFRSH